jgi:hypothetical protein
MSVQASLGIGPECYVSTILSRPIFGRSEPEIAHTGQNCLFEWLAEEEGDISTDPLDVFCLGHDFANDLLSITGCGSSANVTDCINATSKWLRLVLIRMFLQIEEKPPN